MDKNIDIQQYIDSGQLEAYVLGTLSEAESVEITALLEVHPSLKQEVEEIEAGLMGLGSQQLSSEPSDSILTNALSQIEEEESTIAASTLPTTATIKPFAWVRILSIAAGILLLCSLGANFFLYEKWQDSEGELIALNNENDVIMAEKGILRVKLDESDKMLAQLNNPSGQTVRLKGLDIAPESKVILSWNPEDNKVILLAQKLPQAPSDFQYQLWAIIDGKPVDAGLLDEGSAKFMKQLPEGTLAAFAVTLEKRGGSESPTLEKMYVYGEI